MKLEDIPSREVRVIIPAPRAGDTRKAYSIEHLPSGRRFDGFGETLDDAKADAQEALRKGLSQ